MPVASLADPPVWTRWIPIRVRAMIKAAGLLYVAGHPDEIDPRDPYAAFEGRKGARLAVLSAEDGSVGADRAVDASPVFDGMIVAAGRLHASLEGGSVACFGPDSGGEKGE